MKQRGVRIEATDNFPPIKALGRAWAPHQDLYHWVLTMSWPRFFLSGAIVFLFLNSFFALFYWLAPGSVLGARPGSFEDAFFFSVHTLCTIGYGTMSPANRYGNILVVIQAFTGFLFIAILTGINFARFARPTARVLFTQKAVVAMRNGMPHLMFRMANFRHNQVVEAQLHVILLVREFTREGEDLRRAIELPLVRQGTALFNLSWTAMHRIDEHSPFFGPDALERLRKQEAGMFLSLTATDETIGQGIHARYVYRLEDIVWNAQFADVLTILPDGTRQLDYTHFHETVPQKLT